VHADRARPVRVGLSGWNYAHWRNGVFYPPRLPASRWLEFYTERIEPLLGSPKLGPLLWQLPPTFRRDDERLADGLARLPRELRHCVEFRHPSWFVEDTYALLREHGVALAIGDRPRVNAFQARELTADWTYVRFHGGTRGRRGNYSESELREWAARLRGWSRTHEVYAYFNNDWEGFAPRNAALLQRLLAR